MRKAYVQHQKEQHGRRALAVLPIQYPKEILTALDILAVELWGPPGPPRGPDAGRIQAYVCAVARNALAFMASGGADVVDGALFPHTCDSIQGLATLAPDFGGWSKPAFRFLHPRGEDRPSARVYLEAELRSLAAELEAWTGRHLSNAALESAIRLHRDIDNLRDHLLTHVRRFPGRQRELYALLRRGEFLWPGEHQRELQDACASLHSQDVKTGVPLLLTGYVPEPMDLLDTLEDAGALVVADDYAAVGRRVLRWHAEVPGEPFRTLVDRYFALPPCPTRAARPEPRLRYLLDLVERRGVAGVVIHEPKFCEPEQFDVPALRQALAARDTPVLFLETELERELSGQTVTRLEAFVEMVGSRARRVA